MSNYISDPYLPHVPNEQAIREISKIREAAIELAHLIEKVPDGRYKALAKTNLEQVSMWAVKGWTTPV